MHDRRGFLKTGGAVLATGVMGCLAANAYAVDKGMEKREKGGDAFPVKAEEQGVCATCQFWGGIRKVSEDRKTVYCESLGWCNNAKSNYFRSKTTPETGPMNSWKKWEAL